MASVWVIDGQSIYCQDGLPHRCRVTVDFDCPTWQAIDRHTASSLGVDVSQGEFVAYRALVGTVNAQLATELCHAIELSYWHKTHQYCTCCGTATPHPTIPKTCPDCHHHSYPSISPCVITAVTRFCPRAHKRQILLAKHHRRTDIYTLIAGFVESGETLEMAVRREVKEEVGISIDTPTYVGSQAWPYPNNLMMGFVANYHSGDITPQVDEIAEARFFDVDDLPAIAPVGTIARQIIDDICQMG